MEENVNLEENVKVIYAHDLMNRWHVSKSKLAEICYTEAKRYEKDRLLFPDSFFLLAYYIDEVTHVIYGKLTELDYISNLDPFAQPFFQTPIKGGDRSKIVFCFNAVVRYELETQDLTRTAATQETAAPNLPTSHGADVDQAATATIEQLRGQLDKALAERDEARARVREFGQTQIAEKKKRGESGREANAQKKLEIYRKKSGIMIKVAIDCVQSNKGPYTKGQLRAMFEKYADELDGEDEKISSRNIDFFFKNLPESLRQGPGAPKTEVKTQHIKNQD